MAKAEVQITFQNGIREGNVIRFRPGATVQGRVLITPHQNIACRHLYVCLKWYTHGVGKQLQSKIAEEDCFQGTLQKGVPFPLNFAFTLPLEPWSYKGKLLNVRWAVEVHVDVPRGRDIRAESPFILRPDGAVAPSLLEA